MHEDSEAASQQPVHSAHNVDADRAFARKLQLMEDAQEQADYDLARRLQEDGQNRRSGDGAATAQHSNDAFAAAGFPSLQRVDHGSHQSPDELLAERMQHQEEESEMQMRKSLAVASVTGAQRELTKPSKARSARRGPKYVEYPVGHPIWVQRNAQRQRELQAANEAKQRAIIVQEQIRRDAERVITEAGVADTDTDVEAQQREFERLSQEHTRRASRRGRANCVVS